MKKVAIMHGQLTQGGSERQLYDFLKHCDRDQISPTLILSGVLGFWEQPIRDLGVDVHLLEGSKIQKMRAMRRLCKEIGCDVLFCWSSYVSFYNYSVFGTGIKRIASYRNKFPGFGGGRQGIVHRLLTNSAPVIVTNSQESHDGLRAAARRSQRIVYVPNGVDPTTDCSGHRARWRAELGIGDEDRLVVGVGRLTSQKNFARFVDTVAAVNETSPCHGVIAGPDHGEALDLTKRIEETGLPADQIRLIGAVPEARELICAADVFLLSSDFEGMPNVVMEAMASGIPCVVTPVNGIAALITPNVHGIVGDFSVASLAEGCLLVLNDPSHAEAMATRARDRIESEFSPKQSAATLWSLC